MGFESEYGIWVRRAEYDALAAELSAYKEAHEKSCPFVARIRELEAALAEARQLLGVYRVQRDRAEAALAPPPAQDRGGELTKENF